MDNKFIALDSALNMMLNIYIGRENRLKSLREVEIYTEGLVHLAEEQSRILGAVFKAFRHELTREKVNEECIGGYTHILKEILDFNRSLKSPKCIIYGDNWLTEEMKVKMRTMNYCVFDWHTVNPSYIDEYDLYVLCDEPLKTYGIPAEADGSKLLKLWDYLKYKFIVFPSFYEVYMNYRKQIGKKVKCIITGNTNVKNAVRSNLLHTKTVSLSNNSQDIFYDYQMFRHVLKDMQDVEYAVIGLEPFSLHYDASRSRVEWRRCLAYYPVVKTMHNCNDAMQLIELYEEEEKKISQFFDDEYMTSLYDAFAARRKKSEERGAVYDSAKSTVLHAREISDLYNKPFPETVEENKKILEEYVHFCKEKGIRTLFVIPPYPDWYKEHMKKEYYEELVEYLNVLSRSYGAVLIDMLRTPVPDCCFMNYANVNCVGAVKVASCINAIIDN